VIFIAIIYRDSTTTNKVRI